MVCNVHDCSSEFCFCPDECFEVSHCGEVKS